MKRITSIIYLLVIFISCTNSNKQTAITSNETIHKKIDSLEAVLYGDSVGVLNQKAAQDLMLTYDKFIQAFPNDSACDDYLFRNAQIALSLRLGSRSVEYLEKFYTQYPQHPKAPHALFLQAFVFETELNKLDMAKEKYKAFITQYPGHELFTDAQASLENVGKSEEELLKEFEKKNAVN